MGWLSARMTINNDKNYGKNIKATNQQINIQVYKSTNKIQYTNESTDNQLNNDPRK